MTTEINDTDTSVKVEIIPQSSEIVETEMAGESDELKRETTALIEAIKKRAQAEALSAGTLTRETYLSAVRRARAAIEQQGLIVERDRLENSLETIKHEAEKNWESVLKEATDLGERLNDAAKAAWEILTTPRHRSDKS